MEASRSQFACANPEKSAKTKQRLAKIITEEEQKLQFNRSKAMPAPPRKIVRTTLSCFMRCVALWEKHGSYFGVPTYARTQSLA